jgi:hypothetical protein
LNPRLEDDLVEAILHNEARARQYQGEPCCPALLEHPWPAWVPVLARRSPGEAMALLGSGWGGLAPGHAEDHLRHFGLNREDAPGRKPWPWARRQDQVFVLRGRGGPGPGPAWLPVELLAPGDLILLSEGETVPADLRLLRVRELRVDEAALTGEARPVPKAPEWDGAPADLDATAIPDLCFSGTRVVGGTATALVVATGPRTLAASRRRTAR